MPAFFEGMTKQWTKTANFYYQKSIWKWTEDRPIWITALMWIHQ